MTQPRDLAGNRSQPRRGLAAISSPLKMSTPKRHHPSRLSAFGIAFCAFYAFCRVPCAPRLSCQPRPLDTTLAVPMLARVQRAPHDNSGSDCLQNRAPALTL